MTGFCACLHPAFLHEHWRRSGATPCSALHEDGTACECPEFITPRRAAWRARWRRLRAVLR